MEPRTTVPTIGTSSSSPLGQSSATEVPRFGLEIEMHGLLLTLKRIDTPDIVFWSSSLSSTMAGTLPILTPLDDSTYRIPGPGHTDADVNWTSFWGFRAVADAFTTLQVGYQPVPNQPQLLNIAGYALELQTPAQDVSDAGYWVFVRRCLQAFRNTMTLFGCAGFAGRRDVMVFSEYNDRWFPLSDLLDIYNASVDAIQAPAAQSDWPRDKFKLKVSDHLTKLAGGTSGTDGNWEAFFCIKRNFAIPVRPTDLVLNHPQPWAYPIEPFMAGLYSDVQLTYDLELSTLPTKMEVWQNLWGSTWLAKATLLTSEAVWLDPANGTERWKKTPMPDVYTIRTFRALWGVATRAARDFVGAQKINLLKGADVFQPTLTALVAYLFVAGAINYQTGGTSTAKNSFPQLPKTAPASIARELSQNFPVIANLLQGLSESAQAEAAKNLWSGYLAKLMPEYLPPGGPYDGTATYDTKYSAILTLPLGTLNTAFTQMWVGTFDLKGTAANYADATYQKGFFSGKPFFVFWASDAQSSKGAVSLKSKQGTVTTTTGFKILMESRLSSSILNQGFNAYATDAMFMQSYLGLVYFMAPETLHNVATALQAYLPGAGPPLEQNFPKMSKGGVFVH